MNQRDPSDRLQDEINVLLAIAKPEDAAYAELKAREIRKGLEECTLALNKVEELQRLLVEEGFCSRELADRFLRDYEWHQREKLQTPP